MPLIELVSTDIQQAIERFEQWGLNCTPLSRQKIGDLKVENLLT
jgi:hypothetical protein